MEIRVLLTREPIQSVVERGEGVSGGSAGAGVVPSGTDGARIDFYGIVRGWEDAEPPANPGATEAGYPISAIDYEAHEEMAVFQMERLLRELGSRYPLRSALVIHRIGRVPVGDASLLVRLMAPHRDEVLAASAEFINGLKQWVPIWKHPERR